MDQESPPASTPTAEPRLAHASVAEKPPPPAPSPPPDGGFGAWVQVLASWFLIFNAWGISVTFGDYQAYYESGELFTQTSSNISWIGSIQAFLIFGVGAVVGPFYDRGHLRLILLAGTFFVVWGHMMLSLCTQYWQALLAQGFAVGIGGGCLFVPSLAVIQPYFSSNIGLALGIAATGSSIGGVIYPVIFINLIDKVGFGWTTRVIGFVALATLAVPLAFSKMRAKPPRVRSIIDTTAFRDGPFWLCILACFLGYTGCYAAFYYIAFFSEANGWMDSNLALYLVPILNAASAFGRAVPNWLADKIGPTNVVMPGAFMTGVLLLCNLAVHNAAGIILIAIFLGFFSGVFIATPPVLFIKLTEDKTKVGTRVGMAFAVVGLGVLTGGVGGGAVLQHDSSRLDWTSLWIYAGVSALASGIAFLILRIRLCGLKLAAKV
ncbi:MFS general substrate transporter [Hypomontagnella monticulosa]|nr:MFS general substrate transporter [Hypomontagnella monticulosa]